MSLGSHQRSIGASQVHITPKWIIDALGPFYLDPCAADPRPWDCASINVALPADGLAMPWVGRVWLNPPFHRYQVGGWIRRMAEHGNGTALLHARTEAAWFEPIWQRAAGILFMADRLTFCKPDGSPQTISNPESKHYGKPANSGAPPVLVAFGEYDLKRLAESKIPGALVTKWQAAA
jgi:hypothetical protein